MRTGVIGLGGMGAPMARNLQRNGLLETVWNRTRSNAESLAEELGVPAAFDPAELADRCEVIILSVSADADVLDGHIWRMAAWRVSISSRSSSAPP